MYLDLCKFSFRLVKDENWPEDVAKCPLSCADLGWLGREVPEFWPYFSNGKQKFGGAIKAKWFLGLWKFMTDAN